MVGGGAFLSETKVKCFHKSYHSFSDNDNGGVLPR